MAGRLWRWFQGDDIHDACHVQRDALSLALDEEKATTESLRHELQSANTQVLQLQDRIDMVMQDRSKMWNLLENSINEMKISYQCHINAEWQKQGRNAPYPDAPQIVYDRPQTENDIVPRPRTGSEQVHAGFQRFMKSLG